ncbi:MAG TPA: NUDIX domain-containing protein [Gemmatimonadales bacterium]|nr:NUDIX domain-containing protein [Gemmatimonadales bacterium]
MTDVRVSMVDLYVARRVAAGFEFLVLRRSARGRSPGAWEVVHGHIEEGERPEEGARRELREETGLTPAALYNLSRVEAFYVHGAGEVALIPVFAALVPEDAAVVTSDEHDAAEWLPADLARSRLAWPRSRRALDDILTLLADGEAGPLEDLLRVW